jgi:uncharacterized membrane protein
MATKKSPGLAAALGLLIGVFAYLYLGKVRRFFGMLLLALFLGGFFLWIWGTAGYIVIAGLWIFYGYDCYNRAKEINRQLEREELEMKRLREADDAMTILNTRLAKGEITQEEYYEIRKTLNP